MAISGRDETSAPFGIGLYVTRGMKICSLNLGDDVRFRAFLPANEPSLRYKYTLLVLVSLSFHHHLLPPQFAFSHCHLLLFFFVASDNPFVHSILRIIMHFSTLATVVTAFAAVTVADLANPGAGRQIGNRGDSNEGADTVQRRSEQVAAGAGGFGGAFGPAGAAGYGGAFGPAVGAYGPAGAAGAFGPAIKRSPTPGAGDNFVPTDSAYTITNKATGSALDLDGGQYGASVIG